MTDQAGTPLHARVIAAPLAFDQPQAERDLAELSQRAADDPALANLALLLAEPGVRSLLAGIFGGSPFLRDLILRRPASLHASLAATPEDRARALIDGLAIDCGTAAADADAMRLLREFKSEIALLTALADLAGVWPVLTVTRVLTEAADAAVDAATRFLFREAYVRGDWLAHDAGDAQAARGYIVLAMGKHGAFELNYSSDIDLIVFYARDLIRVRDGLDEQTFFVRLTRRLVRLLQERTPDGYVFRVDLRLRPDPGATQVALSTTAALHYYESFGQNWERAALIKARAIAGDVAAGSAFLRELQPFIWRKYLDYAAIADIHAMKRQIHAVRGFGTVAVAGHNIKLGRGGIREIEFFAQTQQMIAGGRQTDLRTPETLQALARLARRGWIREAVRDDLEAAYRFLRRIEHRLQMIADEQTQTLPEAGPGLERLARFSGFATAAEFDAALRAVLETVQRHYVRLFEHSPELSHGGGNMVFAGEQDDPATVAVLASLGYERPAGVITIVRGWHHGRYGAVRTPRARERLTEVQPALIAALAGTADPDAALASFDRFLSALPSGVQLFSLLAHNPNLLDLIAAIMGTAPRLADILSRRRRVLDAVLDPGFFGSLPEPADLTALVESDLTQAADMQEFLDRARALGAEQSFLIGVRVLTGTVPAEHAGGAYANLAEALIRAIHARVEAEMAAAHGRIAGGASVVVAMGKLGGREMTAASDLDLILIYDMADEAPVSDGARPLAASQYYARLTQRLVAAFTAKTAEGSLYDIDLRLRPSGQKGPVATQLSSFVDYQANEAWTWEHMALTRARVVAGPAGLATRVEAAIAATLQRPRDRAKIAADVLDMRQRVAAEKGTTDIWDLKQVAGGLFDLEFIAQHLQLVHAAGHPEVLDQNTAAALRKLAAAGCLSAEAVDELIPAAHLYGNLTQILRLCFDGVFAPDKAPDGMLALLARIAAVPDRARLEGQLRTTLDRVAARFRELIA